METQWIAIICAILFILVVTCFRLCCLFFRNRETDKTFENPSKTKTSSKSSIHSNGSIKSLIKNPLKADAIHDWLTDTPNKFVQAATNTEGSQIKDEEKLRGGTKAFTPLKSSKERESNAEVDSDESEHEALLFDITETEPSNKYENINDLEQLQSTVAQTEGEETSTDDKKMLLKILNNEAVEVVDDKDIEANYSENVSSQEVRNSKFEVMRTMTQESNIHTSDTLPLNMTMTNIDELMKTNNGNEESFFSNSVMKKDSKQETKFEVEIKESSAISSNIQIIEQTSSNVEVTNTRTETQTVFQQSGSAVQHFECQESTISQTDL